VSKPCASIKGEKKAVPNIKNIFLNEKKKENLKKEGKLSNRKISVRNDAN